MSNKIGIVCPYNIYRFGGVQEVVITHARYLGKRGYKVKIIAPTPNLIPPNVIENVINIGKSRAIRTPFKTTADFSYAADKSVISKVLNKQKFDLMHFHEPWVPLLSKQILSEAKKLKIPSIATFHAKLPEGVAAKTIKKIMVPYVKPTLPKLDKLVAVSTVAAQNVKSLTKRDIKIIPNAIEPAVYNPKQVEPDTLTAVEKPSVLFIGRLETRKGVKYLIEAVAMLAKKDRDIRLIIAGDGPLRKDLENLTIKLGLYDTHFLGFVNTEEKIGLLKGSTVFCSPALYGESFGIVLIEAMAMGVPTLGGNNAGYKTVLTGNGKEGLINPKNTSQLAKKIDQVIYNSKLREKLIKWGLDEAKRYSYSKVVDEYEDLYNDLLGVKE